MATYPAAPTTLAGTYSGGAPHITWDAETNATYYMVQRGIASGGPWTLVGRPTTNSFDDVGAPVGTWYYRVAGVQVTPGPGGGRPVEQPGTFAAAVSVVVPAPTPPAPPAVPAAPAGLAVKVSGSSVLITWQRVPAADTYSVYRATSTGGPWTKISDQQRALGINDTPPGSGAAVYYHVTGVNAGGEGTPSAPVGVIAP